MLKRYQSGDVIGWRDRQGRTRLSEESAAWLREIAERTEATNRLRRGQGVSIRSGPTGKHIAGKGRRTIDARLIGDSNPYTWQEVYPVGDGTYADLIPGRAGNFNAYEVNDVIGLGGKIVEIRPGSIGDYRFVYHHSGDLCGQYKLCVVVFGCDDVPDEGVAVSIATYPDLDPVDSGTTDAEGRICFEGLEAGSKYQVTVTTGTYGVVRRIVSFRCEDQEIEIRRPGCLPCITGLPDELPLVDPWGTMTLSRPIDGLGGKANYWTGLRIITGDGYRARCTRCHTISGPGYPCCGAVIGEPIEEVSLCVGYRLFCGSVGLALQWGTPAICPVDAYAGMPCVPIECPCVCDGIEADYGLVPYGYVSINPPLQFWPNRGDADIIECVDCSNSAPMEFALDYSIVGGGESIVTVGGP